LRTFPADWLDLFQQTPEIRFNRGRDLAEEDLGMKVSDASGTGVDHVGAARLAAPAEETHAIVALLRCVMLFDPARIDDLRARLALWSATQRQWRTHWPPSDHSTRPASRSLNLVLGDDRCGARDEASLALYYLRRLGHRY
jgi:hypothetical protein